MDQVDQRKNQKLLLDMSTGSKHLGRLHAVESLENRCQFVTIRQNSLTTLTTAASPEAQVRTKTIKDLIFEFYQRGGKKCQCGAAPG